MYLCKSPSLTKDASHLCYLLIPLDQTLSLWHPQVSLFSPVPNDLSSFPQFPRLQADRIRIFFFLTGSKDQKQGGGAFFSSIASNLSNFGTAMQKSVTRLLGYEGLEVINPEGGTGDAKVEAIQGRWKQEERDNYWKTMQKYIGADVTSLVTLPVLICEPMTTLLKMAEIMEYSHLLDLADQCEDPHMRMVYASTWAISVYYAFRRTWKSFNPILGETYEMVNHGGVTWIAEQVSHHPPIGAGHVENDHFVYEVTSQVKTKFLGNSVDILPMGRTRVTLKRDGVVLELEPPPSKANNLIFGRTWVDVAGEMIMTNITMGEKAVLCFQPYGWFGGLELGLELGENIVGASLPDYRA